MSNSRTRKKSSSTAKSRPAPPTEAKRKLPVAWILGGVIAAALVVAVLLSLNSGGDDAGALEVGDPVISGETLDRLADGGADPAIGLPIPTVVGQSYDGTEVRIDAADGQQAIVFLAHWCPHCQDEVPEVQAWLEAGAIDGTGVTIKSVASGTSAAQPNYPPSAWFEREGWTVPVVMDDSTGSVATAFGLPGYPFWVFTDAAGNVTARLSGRIPVESIETILAASAG